jgi:hypothetical protein
VSPDPSARVLIDACRDAAWAPIVVFATHVVCGRFFDVYSHWPEFDVPMHIAGGAAIAFFLARVVAHAQYQGFVGPLHPAARFVGVFGLTAAAALHWEFAEFLSDRFAGTHAQGGLEDTLGDLLNGLAGGATWLAVAWLVSRTRRPVSDADQEKRGGAA